MRTIVGRLAGTLLALFLLSDLAAAQSKITVAVGGGACLCYLPTVLAKQLGEFDKAGLAVELVDLKGGSDALKAVLGGSADVVSGYFDHCVNLAAKKQELTAMTAIPGWFWWCRPPITAKSNRSRIWPARRSASARRDPRPTSFSNIC
jgi:ABC-type nitrate/sulfonate/bicarbonate transport system substrate-binding protein